MVSTTPYKDRITVLGLSGSLRRRSYNYALLIAMQQLSQESVEFVIFDGVNELPLFNPDREEEEIPIVSRLNNAVALADGIVIASPEYAGGISGVMKNTLDWLVGGPNFINIPVALPNTSPRASLAQSAIRTVLRTMSAIIVEEASIKIPLLSTELDAPGIIDNSDLARLAEDCPREFEVVIRQLKSEQPL